MEFSEMAARAVRVRERYAAYEVARYGRAWTAQEVALGLVGDVGDLMKLVQARSGVRDIPEAEAKLAHELADCLWSVMVLAQMHGVDLEAAFGRTTDELEAQLAQALGADQNQDSSAKTASE